ncbi:MAG: AAA family ATPase [Acidobacteria bacterium]|nr:AAA family ATPase [Acidobacteriota bacterium]
MFLRRFALTHAGCIERLEIDFRKADKTPRKWTLILGENGAGKSTILRALALLTAGSEALPELLPDPSRWIRNGRSSCLIEAEMETAQGAVRKIRLELRRGDTVLRVLSRNRKNLSDLDRALAYTDRSYCVLGYGVTRRPPGIRPGPSPAAEAFDNLRARAVATLFSPDARLHALDAWAMAQHYAGRRAGLAIVKETLAGVLPHVRFSRIDTRKRQLLFHTPDGEVALEQLSDGYQNVAAWCGDLVYRVTEMFPDFREPLKARGLLLVDEVDLHLHPRWQRLLYGFLTDKLPNLQIVATTHSPLMAHNAGQGELHFLHRRTPSSPAALSRYDGDPSSLMVHQLILSEAFAIRTVDSMAVERLREEYRRLAAKKALRARERARKAELESELADLPDWHKATRTDRRLVALLKKLERVRG